MASYLWRKYADYVYSKWERTILWDMVEPYRRPKSFTPLVTIYIAAFYSGVIGAAITEQLYKEKYWEDHPGEAVPLMRPKFYGGPWKIYKGEVPLPGSSTQEFISIAKEKIKSGLDTRKPWTTMINLQSFTFPTTETTIQRLRTNLPYFRVNYAITILFTLFLTLLRNPISLIVFIITMSAWLLFYFLRYEPLMVLGHVIGEQAVLVGLSVMTVGLLLLTDVTANVVAGVVIGVVLVIEHGILRTTEDLFVGNEERVGERMALKETASSSYSLLG